MKITYAICVCSEYKELYSLLNFLIKNKDQEDDINVLVDSKNVTPQVREVLVKFSSFVDVHERPFCGNFATHRNFQNSKCTGHYIFTIDADEIPQEVLIKGIKRLVLETGGDMFYVPRINICPGYTEEWLKKLNFQVNNAGWINWPDWQGRLFKNSPTITWGKNLHESIRGFTKPVRLDENPNLALWHIKTVEKQDSQDHFYKALV